MKKNMLPFMGIAFIVAIICTGVWYGLLAGKLRSSNEVPVPGHAIVVAARDLDRGTVIQSSDLRVSEIQGALSGSFSKPQDVAGATLLTAMKVNEPLLEERVALRISDAERARGPVPTGMRAVTMHIYQSESVLSLLRPGSRVDLQAVTDRNGGAELRTMLENVQILSVSSADGNGNRPPGAVVTVLIRAQDADPVALADAGTRIRLALRNPMDEDTRPRRAITLAALFSDSNKLAVDVPQSTHSASAAVWDHPVQLHIRVLSVSDAALEQLRARTSQVTPDGIGSDKAWRVSAFKASDDAMRLVRGLEQQHQLEVVAGEKLMAGIGRSVSYQAGAKPGNLQLRLSPTWLATNKLTLQVNPQVGAATGSAIQLPDLSSFLIQSQAEDLGARLFPGHSWEHQHLVIFVTTHAIEQSSAVALAGAQRGR
jgi:Flp pilus assembly protein CpaB